MPGKKESREIAVRPAKRTRKGRERSILEIVKNVKIEVAEPSVTSPVRPLSISVPGFSAETTDIGVAEICGDKALYLRLNLRGGG